MLDRLRFLWNRLRERLWVRPLFMCVLSSFVGAFIFSIVALIALMNGYYNVPGRFALFVLTVSVFAIVIITFVRWVDRIARLGRLGETIDKVEAVTLDAL